MADPVETPVAAADPKPAAITTATLTGAPAETKPFPLVEPVAAATVAAVDPSDQVTVKPIRSFQGVEGFKNPQSEPFVVSKLRAADLFAVGLIEYVDAADEDAAITAAADEQVAAVQAAAQSRRTKK